MKLHGEMATCNERNYRSVPAEVRSRRAEKPKGRKLAEYRDAFSFNKPIKVFCLFDNLAGYFYHNRTFYHRP